MATINGSSDDPDMAGLVGENTANGAAIWGTANPKGRAVVGVSESGVGLWGHVENGRAVVGAVNQDGAGVWGEVKTGRGVVGVCQQGDGAGVTGDSPAGDGIIGRGRRGVVGISPTYQGVYGQSDDNAGVVGESTAFHAVFGISHSEHNGGVFGANTHPAGWAAMFDGRVFVKDDLHCPKADVAEDFDAADDPEIVPGSVVAVSADGTLALARKPYDTAVAGIVSGAPGFSPALRLGSISSERRRLPVALVGTVMCLVDADHAPVAAGDLLTSSATPGHAMRADDASARVGAVIGKALRPLAAGRALVPVLAVLQ